MPGGTAAFRTNDSTLQRPAHMTRQEWSMWTSLKMRYIEGKRKLTFHPLNFPFGCDHEEGNKNYCARFAAILNVKDNWLHKEKRRDEDEGEGDGRIINPSKNCTIRFETSDIASRVIIDRQNADRRLQIIFIARVAFGHVPADIAVKSFNIF